jgi:hypothetical protein
MTLIRTAALILAVNLAAPIRAEERQYTLPDAVEAWLNSPHARRGSEAFTHRDKEGEIPVDCATVIRALGSGISLAATALPPGRSIIRPRPVR